MKRSTLILTASQVMAGGGGFLASVAFSQGPTQPQKTVTITLKNGPTGPTGPTGPAGAVECNKGYTFGNLVINHPGGQTTIQTCIKD
jgi:hypothetical protein